MRMTQEAGRERSLAQILLTIILGLDNEVYGSADNGANSLIFLNHFGRPVIFRRYRANTKERIGKTISGTQMIQEPLMLNRPMPHRFTMVSVDTVTVPGW